MKIADCEDERQEGKWWGGEEERNDVAADGEGSQAISTAETANVQR